MNVNFAIFSAICALGVSSSARATSADTIAWDSTSLSPGQGFNTITGKVRGRCVVIDPAAPKPVSGQDVVYHLEHVENEAQLDSYMKVSVSAKYASIASGSASVTQESRFNSYSSYMVVTSQVIDRSESVIDRTLKEPIIDPTKIALLVTSPSRFIEMCGDAFIAGRSVGGDYTALVEIHTSNSSEKSSVDLAISGGGGPFSASGNFTSALSSVTKNRATKISILRGGGDGAIVTDTDSLLQSIASFSKDIHGKPAADLKPYEATLQDYASLGLPAGVTEATFVNNPKVFFLQDASRTLEGIRKQMADVSYVLRNPQEFNAFDPAPLKSFLPAATDAAVAITRQVANCLPLQDCGQFKTPSLTSISLPDRPDGPTRTQLVAAVARSRAALDPLWSDGSTDQWCHDWINKTFGGYNPSIELTCKAMVRDWIRPYCDANGCRVM